MKPTILKEFLMKSFALALTLTSVLASPSFAQIMPPPHAAPRTPVHRETLAERKAAQPRDVDGQATVIDGEKLKVDTVDIRLFGIVPPQLSASYGPQARAALDAIVGGGQEISCHIRDRDRDGRLLATCKTANGSDPAIELLRRGLAVAARGSITDTEFAQIYIAAEQAAQAEKIGMWSVSVAAPVNVPSPAVAAAPTDVAKTTDFKTAAQIKSETQVKSEAQLKTEELMKSSAAPVAKAAADSEMANVGVFARYQILIAGVLMLLTALSVIGALTYRRITEKRDEMRALAAALRGELLAARAVCLTRVKSINTREEDTQSAWPRIRSTLYQAYVGRLGWLGAELARQVASIYGQASDYASYYNSNGTEASPSSTPKKQALMALTAHIDSVLPRLAAIEQTGERDAIPQPLKLAAPIQARAAMPKPVAPMIAQAAPEPKLPEQRMAELRSTAQRVSEPKAAEPRPMESRLQEARSRISTIEAKPQAAFMSPYATGPVAPPPPSAPVIAATASVAPAMPAPVAPIQASAGSQEGKLFSLVRHLRERFSETEQPGADPFTFDEPMSDYAAIIEEEAERFTFGANFSDAETAMLGKTSRH